jgi:hypothetical protein
MQEAEAVKNIAGQEFSPLSLPAASIERLFQQDPIAEP